MPVNTRHQSYDASVEGWQRIRDVLAGDAAMKKAGEKYIPRLEGQTDSEYEAYLARGSFYNATARTVAGYLGLMFRRGPVFEYPGEPAPMHEVIKAFANDVDLAGATLDGYARKTAEEVVALGRAATLVDWDEVEGRAYLTHYAAEDILNWRETRIDGSMKVSLVVLAERDETEGEDPFELKQVEQLRVLKIVDGRSLMVDGRGRWLYQVEIWQRLPVADGEKGETEWQMVRRVVPLRLGKPLEDIPFVFHGPTHSRPGVEKSPIEDLVAVNLDHYRLNADFKHGMHFTALPTAFVTGFENGAELRIGSSTAWVTETIGATAQFLEFQGDVLMTFERALDRAERLMTVMGSRLLQGEQRFSETAEALAIRQAGETSIIGSVASSVSASLNEALRWVYWWHSAVETPWDVTEEVLCYELNQEFDSGLIGATELEAMVRAWQSGAISQETLLHNLRVGELLPPGRTEAEERRLLQEATEGTELTERRLKAQG